MNDVERKTVEQPETRVLDQGIVRLIDFMGGDAAVVQSARVSFGKGMTDDERDKKLLFFLLANGHETPFEHSVFKFHIKCPIFVARQWFRHRMASYNEISGRYTEMKEEFCLPEQLRTQKARNYKYEEVEQALNEELKRKIAAHYSASFALYQELLDKGVAKEQARIVLPLSLYTQFYWTINCRSLMNFVRLRLEEHAQYEIRQYARVIDAIFREKMPWTHEAFEKYVIAGEQWCE
ncbi:FAD-dependent thymidylate synthase [candidate division KSB1 bacterium]|nr:FAD-dependent thymidylate synthase [candidate division KSB1 bacterium]RQW01497.1 MAG: FAD-dependent thymidylate synthase [candidate division KSB1 bacterium]